MSFDRFVRSATGRTGTAGVAPYPYQQRLADEGLPDLLRVPTGAGKTAAAVLPWLYRRCAHPDPIVRAETPHRLVFVLPQRALVEQTLGAVQAWLTQSGLDDRVGLHVLMGGAERDDRWQREPGREAILIGTQDMVLSRLLLRGYGEGRSLWPVSFGLLHSGTQFVFDELQLMGPGLPTSLQLDGLRRALGPAIRSRTMWMSATVDPARLRTFDHRGPDSVVELADADRVGALVTRLAASRVVRRAPVDAAAKEKDYFSELANHAITQHQPGTRTLVVVNTVDRALGVFRALEKRAPGPTTVLLHSRFRPGDRREHLDAALAEPDAAGTIVVTTQVLEAGVDTTSRVLITETAPWSSIVQRAGRCNRAGEHSDGADLWWVDLPAKLCPPYDADDLASSTEALDSLEGSAVTSTDLQNAEVAQTEPLHPVLRRRDLLDLIDTAPDLAGNELDVSRWIREDDVPAVSVAWRDVDDAAPDIPPPRREEICPAPLADVRALVDGRSVYSRDQISGEWRRLTARGDVRPGGVVVLRALEGGYDPALGWSPSTRLPVEPLPPADLGLGLAQPEAVDTDPLTLAGRWVPLGEHLEDTQDRVGAILTSLGVMDLTPAMRQAAERAALYHDIGKVHPVFAASMARAAGEPPDSGYYAKTPVSLPLRHHPRSFRHELASALVVLDPGSGLLDDVEEADLCAYLVAAHHGKVRMSLRARPGEDGSVLGVRIGDQMPSLALLGHDIPAITVNEIPSALGSSASGLPSWQARARRLRDRVDLGPFRLVFLEAVVRMADWQSSASYAGESR